MDREMSARELLEQVRYIDDEVAELRELRASVWDDLTSTTARLSQVAVFGSSDPHRLDAAAKLAVDVDAKLHELAEAKRAALGVINRLDDSRQRSVLLAYYVNCRTRDGRRKTWEDVAGELRYSLRQVHRLRDDGLAAVESWH